MTEVQPLRVEVEPEADGRILAAIPALSGVMAYGATEEEAVRSPSTTAKK
jgi:predicted RNase H-like HicB family nuclease